MTFQNPVTKEEFEDEDAYVESLITEYERAKKELYQWGQDELAIVNALKEKVESDCPGATKGTYSLDGVNRRAKIKLKLNASYPKNGNEKHPLWELLKVFDNDLRDMVKVDYSESGSKIQGLLDRYREGKLKPGDSEELAKALIAIRVEKSGKPEIVVETLSNVDAGKPGDGTTPMY